VLNVMVLAHSFCHSVMLLFPCMNKQSYLCILHKVNYLIFIFFILNNLVIIGSFSCSLEKYINSLIPANLFFRAICLPLEGPQSLFIVCARRLKDDKKNLLLF